mmetsp:Transcript_47320/g.143294  ORF Transcript_47320/g.143294 Transcript_47320/m.143294 type:complete len:235 (+) Transcript_47320:359-1063(+)
MFRGVGIRIVVGREWRGRVAVVGGVGSGMGPSDVRRCFVAARFRRCGRRRRRRRFRRRVDGTGPPRRGREAHLQRGTQAPPPPGGERLRRVLLRDDRAHGRGGGRHRGRGHSRAHLYPRHGILPQARHSAVEHHRVRRSPRQHLPQHEEAPSPRRTSPRRLGSDTRDGAPDHRGGAHRGVPEQGPPRDVPRGDARRTLVLHRVQHPQEVAQDVRGGEPAHEGGDGHPGGRHEGE